MLYLLFLTIMFYNCNLMHLRRNAKKEFVDRETTYAENIEMNENGDSSLLFLFCKFSFTGDTLFYGLYQIKSETVDTTIIADKSGVAKIKLPANTKYYIKNPAIYDSVNLQKGYDTHLKIEIGGRTWY